ncbi:hypothetical protein GCM10023322_63400 [Rugosimonospora acidiphila]|uniref:Uncharacterized protein n=1 Tax=Rugosimonospora acidiphila TaxID=556531 RepID=A0ABP9SJ15_9ACTN
MVRRLAAVDMYGTVGSPLRRRVILVEFWAGVVLCASGGAALAAVGQGGNRVFGWWLLSVAINYVPLALSATSLSRPGALDTELAGVDVRAQLRYYGVAQLVIAVPLAVAVLALAQSFRSRRDDRGR